MPLMNHKQGCGDYAGIKLGIIGRCKNPEQCGNNQRNMRWCAHVELQPPRLCHNALSSLPSPSAQSKLTEVTRNQAYLEPLSPALAVAQQLPQFWTVSELPVRPTWQGSIKLKPIFPSRNGSVVLEEAGVNSRLSLGWMKWRSTLTSCWWCLQENCSAPHAERRWASKAVSLLTT